MLVKSHAWSHDHYRGSRSVLKDVELLPLVANVPETNSKAATCRTDRQPFPEGLAAIPVSSAPPAAALCCKTKACRLAGIAGKARQGGQRMRHHMRRNGLHHFGMRRLVFEGVAEFRLLQRRQDLLRDAAGEIDAAARHEDQGDVAGDAAEIGDEERQRLLGLLVGAGKRVGGDVGRLFEARLDTVGLADGVIEVLQTTAANDLFGRDPALDGFEMRPDLQVALAARSKIDMAAFARHRYPLMLGMDQAGYAKPGAWPEHGARSGLVFRGLADAFAMVVGNLGDRQRLCFEVVDDKHVLDTEIGDHRLRADHPVAIGERNLVALHGACHGKDRRARLQLALFERQLDRVVDRLEIRRLHDGKMHLL
ncbi:hypothetical protein RHSP_72706 [Rhizobium freirei PRF 81]|uniref:Uncharacterized protein n=1 Tax=Rhizobium freirei PRF 81 TaxID=363754 RepID=N6UUR2_9HYPH|nr:hypothetical protein RHSP_72706 [Rhizobium freirei PRF 81]